ncbi:MAG: hypothetical protein DWQ09_14210 [Proteobacteria bacterium]|nr:MAG: hypothetical protein DWQ09_14210 [Pseudomonadota bacterium]
MDARWGKRDLLQAPVVFGQFGGGETQGAIRNISHRGLYVETAHPLQVASCALVSLMAGDNPEKCLYQTAALVVHRDDQGIGVMLPEGAGHIVAALCQAKPTLEFTTLG